MPTPSHAVENHAYKFKGTNHTSYVTVRPSVTIDSSGVDLVGPHIDSNAQPTGEPLSAMGLFVSFSDALKRSAAACIVLICMPVTACAAERNWSRFEPHVFANRIALVCRHLRT
jgi:hypothetical protein